MTPKRKVDEYDRRNLECARIIQRAPAKYGGPESGPAMWARLVIARLDDIASGRDLAVGRQSALREHQAVEDGLRADRAGERMLLDQML